MEKQLTGYQNKKLREAIQKCFNTDNLNLLLIDNKEKLKVSNLDDLPANGSGYLSKIQALIDHLKSYGLIDQFLTVASDVNPQGEIAYFTQYYKAYQKYDFDCLISILDIIKQEQRFIDKFKVSEKFQKSSGDELVTYNKSIAQKSMPIDDIIYFLLASSSDTALSLDTNSSDFEQEEIVWKINDFVQFFLIKDLNIQEVDKDNKFQSWTDKLKDNRINLDLINKNPTNDGFNNDNYHLLIIVEPKVVVKEQRRGFNLKAELYSSNEQACKRLGEEKFCTLLKLSREIKYFIQEFRKNYGAFTNLTIELFVNYKVLENIANSSIYTVDEENLLYIEEYNFVVRSLDRANIPDFINRLKEKWLKEKWTVPNPNEVDVIEDITKFVSPKLNKDIKNLLNIVKTKCRGRVTGFKICSNELPNGLPISPKDKQRLFDHMFELGIPLCIWIKDCIINGENISSQLFDLQAQLDAIFAKSISLEDKINELLKAIKIFRIQVYDENSELIIGVLYDHPDRIPECLTKI